MCFNKIILQEAENEYIIFAACNELKESRRCKDMHEFPIPLFGSLTQSR